MAVYVSIRGWLECDREQLTQIKGIISKNAEGHYSGGWAFPGQPFNWTSYVFYGGDIQEGDTSWLHGQLEEISRISSSDSSMGVQGLFIATSEVDGAVEWQIRDGGIHVLPIPGELQYLGPE
ncbi:hypothetical protein QQY24_31715 [Streptomyces sp. TG1A-8]|uniref:hypothetical protein n=1 Tax=Streptomyces sp. TG1A-8 TaxID=3051385 RepID=UPI00265C1D1F|nr:hypothetical protein [Streptomyces sp. TG1A-8]MDO0929697.1 hypothetical protein [Streptomyces sp. TG1A-8]